MRDLVMQTKSLFISAGHSDTDPGAIGHGYTEADFVLEFRDLVASYLHGRVKFTKDGERGQNLPLREAVKMAAGADIAVEFHCNAFNGKASGVETLSAAKHYPLGNALCQTISEILKIPNRGAKGEASGQHSRLAFIRDGNGIIVELFFIDNASDLFKYKHNKLDLARAVGVTLIDAVTT